MEHFVSDKLDFYYTLKKENRATFRLEMTPDGGVTLISPQKASFGAADRFLLNHAFQINAFLSAVAAEKEKKA